MSAVAPGMRGLLPSDWAALKHFTQAEVAAGCWSGQWTNVDAGSLYLLDEFAGYLVGDRRLIESVVFMPTRSSADQPTAIWDPPDSNTHEANSLHYRGRAFDLMFPKTALATVWLTALRFAKWGGVGVYPFWRPGPGLHLDTRWTGDDEQGKGFRVMWWADQDRKYHYLNEEADIASFFDALRRAA